MSLSVKHFLFLFISLSIASCVSKKQYSTLQQELRVAQSNLDKCDQQLNKVNTSYSTETAKLKSEISSLKTAADLREEQIIDLRSQVTDARSQRDKQVEQVGDLAVLSKEANQNIQNTLGQLERKDKYIVLLQQAKSKADSINLALAVNLKSALKDGIEDEDIEVKVDKTVVFINLSDKMLYTSGSSEITPRAGEVLGKIAAIVKDRPDLEVMVEGYTDSQPINTACIKDNWDLSVKRATSVVRTLQTNYGINPDRLIAAGRGEYNALASNDTAEGRSTNRRTRVIILPKLNQFYDLLNPDKIPN